MVSSYLRERIFKYAPEHEHIAISTGALHFVADNLTRYFKYVEFQGLEHLMRAYSVSDDWTHGTQKRSMRTFAFSTLENCDSLSLRNRTRCDACICLCVSYIPKIGHAGFIFGNNSDECDTARHSGADKVRAPFQWEFLYHIFSVLLLAHSTKANYAAFPFCVFRCSLKPFQMRISFLTTETKTNKFKSGRISLNYWLLTQSLHYSTNFQIEARRVRAMPH